MRIVYVLTSLGMGGAEKQALALAERMVGRGHTAALLVLKPPVAEQWPTAIPAVHLNMRRTPLSGMCGTGEAHRFLRDFKPDVVHSHSFHANIVARMLKVAIPSLTVVSTVHNIYEGGWTRMLAYRFTDPLAHRTIAVSQAAAVRFISLKAIPTNKCLVIPNGIDTSEFTPSADRREQTRAAMGITDEFVWLAAGRIAAAKDYPNLMHAFSRMLESQPNAVLWIAGSELPDNPTSRKTKVKVLGFSIPGSIVGKVRKLGLRRDMPALLDAADAFVLSSAWEGMPLVVGEAMAMEKPVVATDAGGVRELVGDAGTIVPVRDPAVLADAMLSVMQLSLAARQAQGRAARERITAHFGMDASADAWETLYRSALVNRVRAFPP
jgi:glycosyltransferase involved in cell wall biosynthesis